MSANATIWNYDTNQQLTIRQGSSGFTAGNGYCPDNNGFTLTFDGLWTNNFNTLTAVSHAGGVIKGTDLSGAFLAVNNIGANLVLGTYFKLFSQAAVGFTSVILQALDPGLAWQNNLAQDGCLQAVVALATLPTLGVSQAGNMLTFSWTEARYHLQSQTNALNCGLYAIWFGYPGGGTSGGGAMINPANPAVFYRLCQ